MHTASLIGSFVQGSAASYEWDARGDAGLHVFLAYNGSVCPTSCKAPEGPTCEAACVFASDASWYSDVIEGLQVRLQVERKEG